jgi:hypothetical protein
VLVFLSCFDLSIPVLFSFSLVPSSVQRHSVFALKNRVFPAQRLSLLSRCLECCAHRILAFSLPGVLCSPDPCCSQIFARAFCFSPELPHRPAQCFPALLAIFLAPVILFFVCTVFWPLGPISSPPSASIQPALVRVPRPAESPFPRWPLEILATRPPSCSSFGVRFLLSLLGRDLFPAPVPSASRLIDFL